MKRFLLIGILFIYVIHSIRIFTPFISYAVNKAYIVSNLCINTNKPELKCDGKCYLKKELAATSDKTAKDQATIDYMFFLSLHNSEKCLECEKPVVNTFINTFQPYVQLQFQTKHISIKTPPPQHIA